jgi:hypothetical protein
MGRATAASVEADWGLPTLSATLLTTAILEAGRRSLDTKVALLAIYPGADCLTQTFVDLLFDDAGRFVGFR